MKTRSVIIITVSILILLGLAYMWPFGKSSKILDTNTSDLVVDVWMNEQVEKVTGRAWPRAKDGEPLGMTTIQEPCEVALHLPSAKVLRLESKQTTLQQERGVVTLVSVLPLNKAVEFDMAVTKAEEIARAQGIKEQKFFDTLSSWRKSFSSKDTPGSKYMTRALVESGINLYVSIKPSGNATGFFITLEFHKAAAEPE